MDETKDFSLSVIMAVYNGDRYLAEAIKSVLAQTYGNFEFIIVNDASVDGTQGILESYQLKDPRIQILLNQTRSGQSATRNRAIERAKGEYVAIVDADDICHETRFERQVAYLKQNPHVSVVSTAYNIIDEHGRILGKRGRENPEELIRSARVPVHNPTCMIRRKAFDRWGVFKSSYDYAEDAELYFRWYIKGAVFSNLPEELYGYRIHGKNVSLKKIKHQIALLLLINVRMLFSSRVHFSSQGYKYVLEQILYLMYLILRAPFESLSKEKRI